MRKRPHTHREIAKAYIESDRILRRLEGRYEFMWLPDWLKIEIYNLFMVALPLIITVLIWLLMIAAFYWWLTS